MCQNKKEKAETKMWEKILCSEKLETLEKTVYTLKSELYEFYMDILYCSQLCDMLLFGMLQKTNCMLQSEKIRTRSKMFLGKTAACMGSALQTPCFESLHRFYLLSTPLAVIFELIVKIPVR